ncbi:MAG: MBL fold metallo-hydrolase [Bacteroidota bacterium]|nr:MBL fold metallo-hydrolase [Bacteroidota bacterium]
MKITFLGTGTSTGNPQLLCDCRVCHSKDAKDKRLRSSIYIETPSTSILVDCGPDFRQQAFRANIRKIDGVILTHEHYDHVGGLDDLRPYCTFSEMPLFAYQRVLSVVKASMPYSFSVHPYPGVPLFDVHSIQNEPFSIGDLNIIPVEVFHYKLPVLGFRIGNMAYLTDFNSIQPSEVTKLAGVKVLIVDALREEPHISHNTLSQALSLIDSVKPDSAWLIHMSHDMGLHEEVDPALPKGVSLSWDGLTLDC